MNYINQESSNTNKDPPYSTDNNDITPQYKTQYYNLKDPNARLILLSNFYTEISKKLFNNNMGGFDDPLLIKDFLSRTDNFKDADLNRIYRHLLNYTYAATALEVKNHTEVNMQLQKIHKLLETLVSQSKTP